MKKQIYAQIYIPIHILQIAKILKEDNVLTVKAYYAEKKEKLFQTIRITGNENSIVAILERMDYCGHTVNFKSYSKSHKLKKRIPTTKEQQAVNFVGELNFLSAT